MKQALNREPVIFLTKKLWQFAGVLRPKIALFVSMSVVANCILLAGPIIFGTVISEIQEHGITSTNFPYIAFLLLLLILKELGFWLLHAPSRVIERVVAFQTSLNYRRHLLAGVLDLRMPWHSDHDSGDTIDKIYKAVEGLFEFSQHNFQVIQISIKLLGTSMVLLWFSPWIGASVFIFVILSFIAMFQFDKRLIPQYRALNEYSNRASASLYDALANVTTIKILHIEKPVLEGVVSQYALSKPLFKLNAILNESKWFTGMMLFQIIGITPIALYIWYHVSLGHTIDVGTISTLYLYLADLIFVFYTFGSTYENFMVYKNRVFNADPIERELAAHRAINRLVAPSWQHLDIAKLTFSYSGAGDVANLKGVSLRIRRGERIAVIGESGSGKTTFLKVLHGLYPSATGEMRFDGQNPLTKTPADIDLKTMLVPQEPEIFSATIRVNITLGVEHEERQVMHATRLAAFDKVLQQLPKGLDSVINEKGVNLSGGQKQRLALARALLFCADKELILLDESTSSVDPENELDIYHNIWAAFPNRTIIASIHKMNLLKLFDRIIMFEHGRIVDEGTFDELLLKNASFRTAWKEFVAMR